MTTTKQLDEKLADQWESLTRSVVDLKAERDEMDESIHAAHARAAEIVLGYHATDGYPIEAVDAVGGLVDDLTEEVERLREQRARLTGALLMIVDANRREGWEPRFPEPGHVPTPAEAIERVTDELFNQEVDPDLAEGEKEEPQFDDGGTKRNDAERVKWFRDCNYMPWTSTTPEPK